MFLSLLSKLKREESIELLGGISKVAVLPIKKVNDLNKGQEAGFKMTKAERNERKQKVSEYLNGLGEDEIPMPIPEMSEKFGIAITTLRRHLQNNYLTKYNKFYGFDPSLKKDRIIAPLIKKIKADKNINIFLKSRLLGIADKQQLTVKSFFRLVKLGVEDILGIKINNRELSADYLTKKNPKTNTGNKWYINDRILESLRFTDGYALPSKSLFQMKRNLIEAFKEKSAYFKYLIELYKSISPWSYKFSKQNNIITDYFKNIETLEKAYWFGFLLAEGHIMIRKNKTLDLTLSALDLNHLIEFCKTISFDYRKLRNDRFVGKKGQTLRRFSLDFLNTEFCDNLIENGFPDNGKTSNNPDLRFPYWIFSDKRFAMAMLLGLFDGDGSHHLKFPNERNAGEKGLTPTIKIKSRPCLEDIKNYFNQYVEGDVKGVGNGYFELNLKREFFNDLLSNYKDSLERKRYEYSIKDSNYRWEISKKLLGKGWSFEEIYSKFGYVFNPKHKERIINHFKEWFADDPLVKDSNGEVSLHKIIEVYGKLENNPLVITERERVILRKREGWSLEKIYFKELNLKLDPSNSRDFRRFKQKFKELFKDDPLIMGYEDILKRIEEVYNPANML